MNIPEHVLYVIQPPEGLGNMFASCYSCGSQEQPAVQLGTIERRLRLELFVEAHRACEPVRRPDAAPAS